MGHWEGRELPRAAESCGSVAAPSLLAAEEGWGQLRTVAGSALAGCPWRIEPSWIWGFLGCQEPAKGRPR